MILHVTNQENAYSIIIAVQIVIKHFGYMRQEKELNQEIFGFQSHTI